MLERKTQGNLDEQEALMIENLLADLRMQYVSFNNAPTAGEIQRRATLPGANDCQ